MLFAVVGLEGDAPDSSLRTNNVTGNEEALNANAFFHIGSKDVPLVLEGEKRVEKKQAPVGELTNKLQQCPHTSVVQKSSISTERPSKLHNQRRVSLTPKQISSCIMSSEATRIICSLTIALLVVLSYVDRPLLGRNLVKSESVVASRPFYILLLTDITILLARLSIERRRAMEKAKEEEEEEEERMSRHEEDGQNWAGAIKVLETGLVVYQSICAVFMDFCVYAVVVICGLSFV